MAHLTAARAPAAWPFPPALRRSIGVIMIGSALSFLDTRPLLDMRLYTSRAFAAASATSFSLGAAVFTVILTRQLAHAASPAAAASAFGATFAWVLAITAVATAPALLLARTERHARTGPPVTAPSAKEDPDEVH